MGDQQPSRKTDMEGVATALQQMSTSITALILLDTAEVALGLQAQTLEERTSRIHHNLR